MHESFVLTVLKVKPNSNVPYLDWTLCSIKPYLHTNQNYMFKIYVFLRSCFWQRKKTIFKQLHQWTRLGSNPEPSNN